jgi:alkaline phosphatase
MSKLPVLGMQTTYDAHALMTDSASAGTAFASGIKTQSGVIGMNDLKPSATSPLPNWLRKRANGSASCYQCFPGSRHPGRVLCQCAQPGIHEHHRFPDGGNRLRFLRRRRPGQPGRTEPTDRLNVWDKLTQNGYTVLNTATPF